MNTKTVPTNIAKILPTFLIKNPVHKPRKVPNVNSPLRISGFLVEAVMILSV